MMEPPFWCVMRERVSLVTRKVPRRLTATVYPFLYLGLRDGCGPGHDLGL